MYITILLVSVFSHRSLRPTAFRCQRNLNSMEIQCQSLKFCISSYIELLTKKNIFHEICCEILFNFVAYVEPLLMIYSVLETPA